MPPTFSKELRSPGTLIIHSEFTYTRHPQCAVATPMPTQRIPVSNRPGISGPHANSPGETPCRQMVSNNREFHSDSAPGPRYIPHCAVSLGLSWGGFECTRPRVHCKFNLDRY